MWAFPAALVLASFGPFAITAALWILADAPSRRLSRWWALGALLLSYVFIPVYAIRRSRLQRFTSALWFAVALGFLIWLSGRVDWEIGKDTYLASFMAERGVPLDWIHQLDPSNPTPAMLLGWFLTVALWAVMAKPVKPEDAEEAEPRKAELMLAAIAAVVCGLGFVLQPQHFEETLRAAFAAAAVCLAVFVLVMLKRAARLDLPDRTIDLLLAAAVTLTILRALTTPNLNGWASERLRSLHFDLALWRSYVLPFAGEASWVAAGIAILRAARSERRGWWLAAGAAMAVAGGSSLLGTLQVLNHVASASLIAWIQLAAFVAMAALLTSLAVRRKDRDIIIPVASRDTA